MTASEAELCGYTAVPEPDLLFAGDRHTSIHWWDWFSTAPMASDLAPLIGYILLLSRREQI